MKRIPGHWLPLDTAKMERDGVLVRAAFADESQAIAVLMRRRGRHWQASEVEFRRGAGGVQKWIFDRDSGWFRCTLRPCAECTLPWFGTDEDAHESACTACATSNGPPDAWVGMPPDEPPATGPQRGASPLARTAKGGRRTSPSRGPSAAPRVRARQNPPKTALRGAAIALKTREIADSQRARSSSKTGGEKGSCAAGGARSSQPGPLRPVRQPLENASDSPRGPKVL